MHSHQRWKQHSERDLFSLGRLIKFQQKTSNIQRGFEDNFSECDNVASDSFAVLENTAEVLSFLVILHHKVLIDEASQATETATLVPICHGCKQLVLCGDHCQLPPTVKSESPYSAGLKMSLFERLACMVCGRSCEHAVPWSRGRVAVV